MALVPCGVILKLPNVTKSGSESSMMLPNIKAALKYCLLSAKYKHTSCKWSTDCREREKEIDLQFLYSLHWGTSSRTDAVEAAPIGENWHSGISKTTTSSVVANIAINWNAPWNDKFMQNLSQNKHKVGLFSCFFFCVHSVCSYCVEWSSCTEAALGTSQLSCFTRCIENCTISQYQFILKGP